MFIKWKIKSKLTFFISDLLKNLIDLEITIASRHVHKQFIELPKTLLKRKFESKNFIALKTKIIFITYQILVESFKNQLTLNV